MTSLDGWKENGIEKEATNGVRMIGEQVDVEIEVGAWAWAEAWVETDVGETERVGFVVAWVVLVVSPSSLVSPFDFVFSDSSLHAYRVLRSLHIYRSQSIRHTHVASRREYVAKLAS